MSRKEGDAYNQPAGIHTPFLTVYPMSDQPHFPASYEGLRALVTRLRGPEGCPWDQEQTHVSLKRNLLEECYEVLEAIDQGDPRKLLEELGDLLVQVAFHCQMAEEAGAFRTEEVFQAINAKLVARHPHVFGDVRVSSAQEVEANWEALKRQERGGASSLDYVPKELPALAQSQAIQDRAAHAGFDWDTPEQVLDKVVEELRELRDAPSPETRESELGDLLLSIVNAARWQGIHAEDALRQTNTRFSQRFAYMERRCQEKGLTLAELPLEQKEVLWQEAKRALAEGSS